MQLKYSVKKRDILVSRLSFMVFNRGLLVFSILIILFMTWIMIPGSQFAGVSAPVRIFAFGFALIFSTVFYLTFQIVLNFLLVLCSKHHGVEGSHLLEIKDEGLEESTDINQSLHRWNPSFRVREFGNYLLIYPTDGKMFIVPKRRGAYEGDLPGFVALLKAKVGGK